MSDFLEKWDRNDMLSHIDEFKELTDYTWICYIELQQRGTINV